MKAFWMVICGDQGSSTYKRHDSFESAMGEATRLCLKEAKPFVVMESVAVRVPNVMAINGIVEGGIVAEKNRLEAQKIDREFNTETMYNELQYNKHQQER